MIKFVMTCSLAFVLAGETFAQSRGGNQTPRGPRYNPPSGPSRQAPRTRPAPSRPTPPRTSPAPSRPSGPRYNPPSRQNPSRTRPQPPRQSPRQNPPRQGQAPSTPRYDRPTRIQPPARYRQHRQRVVTRIPSHRRSYYATPRFHSPYRYRPVRFFRYTHVPYAVSYRHSVFWGSPFDYYGWVRRNHVNYLYINWVMAPTRYSNGFRVINGYPYMVFNGYYHRYSSFDQCNYQLIDSYTARVVNSYWRMSCNVGYDMCARQRGSMNAWSGQFRYYCAETFRDQNFHFNHYNPEVATPDGYYDDSEDYFFPDDSYYGQNPPQRGPGGFDDLYY